MVLERAATPGADNADIRALALQVVQSLASNGSNIGTLQSGEVAARLKGLRQHMSDDVAVGRAVDAIFRSNPNANPSPNPNPNPSPSPNPNPSPATGRAWLGVGVGVGLDPVAGAT